MLLRWQYEMLYHMVTPQKDCHNANSDSKYSKLLTDLSTAGLHIYPVPEMTYNVFSGTLNPTHFTSLTYLFTY